MIIRYVIIRVQVIRPCSEGIPDRSSTLYIIDTIDSILYIITVGKVTSTVPHVPEYIYIF